jgi:hypothetical protein
MEQVLRMIVLVAVVHGGQLGDARGKARLLLDLLEHGGARRIVDVGPAARQRPFAVGALAHQQNAIVTEDRAAHVHLRRGIPVLDEPRLAHRFGADLGLQIEQAGGDVADLAIALAVVFLGGEVQPGLRQREQPA